MAFKFRSKSSLPITKKPAGNSELEDSDSRGDVLPKFTNAQLNKLIKVYPPWLKDKSGPKQLPGIYQGVLGQVQLQPGINFDSQMTNGQKLLLSNKLQQQPLDYMNRFTDTERVHQLLSASQLSNDTLATIWAHVNQTFPGKLTNREVCLALALIAIFQRLGEGEVAGEALKKDPFSLVRAEKKPPVPVLYPSHASKQTSTKATLMRPMPSSKSIPDNLSGSASSGALLVDFGDEDDNKESSSCNRSANASKTTETLVSKSMQVNSFSTCDQARTKCINTASNSFSLIDMLDGDKFEVEFFQLTQIWLKSLSAMRTIFKRSFDILNVENSRQSAIEALKSTHGKQFSKHLCLCYPIAHNIKFKIDQLSNIGASTETEQSTPGTDKPTNNEQNELFDRNYIIKIDDLMNSINEYWAVLINLFHESGQTKFIELIMDGLNYKRPTVVSRTIGELTNELDGSGKQNVCSICHTNFYLTNNEFPDIEGLESKDLDLIGNKIELISDDGAYYYHAKCANFWLNNVDSTGLPAHRESKDNILCPNSTNPF